MVKIHEFHQPRMGIFKSDYYDNIEFVFRRQKKETEKVDTDFTADCIKEQL